MNCGYCGTPLPKTTHKGGRKKEFCNDACKNRRYRQYKQEKRNADMLEDPIWEKKYRELYVFCVQSEEKAKELVQKLGERLKESEKENEKLKEDKDYWHTLFDEAIDDCVARMKGLGISEKTINEFNAYWQSTQYSRPLHLKKLYESDDKKKIQELEKDIDSLKQNFEQRANRLGQEYERIKNTERWQAKRMAELEAENRRLKDMLDERKGTSLWQINGVEYLPE